MVKVLTYEEKVNLFGDPKPKPADKNGYAILDKKFLENIKMFEFPVIGKYMFHVKVFSQLLKVLEQVKEAGLDKEIDVKITRQAGGTFVPRYQRWSPNYPLSSHAFGIAIDMFSVGSDGVIEKTKWSKEFVKIFKQNGFVWGGDFKSFYDPIHFEVNKIL